MQFGNRIRELREETGLTQKELAERLDVRISYVNKVEQERLYFSDSLLAKFIHRLAEEFNGDEDELLLLADKVSDAVRKRVRERLEAFKEIAGLNDQQLDKVVA